VLNFAAVLSTLVPFLVERKLDYAVIGGVALGGYGMGRGPVDLDLVLDAAAQEEFI
jgi:hypothetical protein